MRGSESPMLVWIIETPSGLTLRVLFMRQIGSHLRWSKDGTQGDGDGQMVIMCSKLAKEEREKTKCKDFRQKVI